MKTQVFIVNNIKISVNASLEEAFSIARSRLKKLGISPKEVKLGVYRRSVDARKKNDIKFVYSISATGNLPNVTAEKLSLYDVVIYDEATLDSITRGDEKMTYPPLIVGAGPAGLFAGLLLAECGYEPTIVERGGSIAERKLAVSTFNERRILDENTNIQFGAGGAGTFSDGKLVTRINDPLSAYVLKKLVEFGAPENILYIAKPHVGTDVLAPIIDKIIERILSLGGRILYHTRYIESKVENGYSIARTTSGDIPYSSLILAIGHSARDTYKSMIEAGYDIEAKPFSVGMRIEHKAVDIDRSMYGDFAGNENLGHAEYNLSYDTKNRGVYTFCMCPGGEVVAAASESGGVVVNGMSHHARSGENSNSAVVCSVFKDDYGNTPTLAIDFQRKIEKGAFIAGGSNYSAPIITVGDFLSDKCEKEPYDITPTYMNASSFTLSKPDNYLPDFVCSQIKNALHDFDKKIAGFAKESAILTGAETRTSAPVRIKRDNETRLASGTDNIYPCGEGAGYAGGITSAAIDGLKTAITIINRFKPFNLGG